MDENGWRLPPGRESLLIGLTSSHFTDSSVTIQASVFRDVSSGRSRDRVVASGFEPSGRVWTETALFDAQT
jgi:hypothetical protein